MILIDNRNIFSPYINLAIEEFLVRNADCSEHDYLFFYVNEPSIVVGKNQSVWKEINFDYLRNDEVKICRRISGGGTVYHDKGNLNFAFISKFSEEKINNYKFFNQPIADAFQKINLDVEMDSRNNILCNGKKFSGSAQFTNRKNIISHGTMLFNADLNTLRNALKENDFKIETRAVGSVRSSVINISEATNKFSSTDDLKNFLTEKLKAKKIKHFTEDEWNEIEKLAKEKFETRAWIYARSPLTKITREEIEIEIEDGKIISVSNFSEAEKLKGVPYEYHAIKKALENFSNADEILKNIF